MSRTAQLARVMAHVEEQSLSDLLFGLGKLLEDRPGVIHTPNKTWSSEARPWEGLALDCTVRVPHAAPAPVNAERAAAIRADMEETEALMDGAWQRFMQHGSRSRYRAECQRIVNRDNLDRVIAGMEDL